MIVANYPLVSNCENTITNIDSQKDLNITSVFNGSCENGYFIGTNAEIYLNRPYVHNYTNRFLGMPWEIDFSIYIENCKDHLNILTIYNPSSNVNKNKTLIISTNTTSINPYEICIDKEIFNEGWVDCKIQCTGAGGELTFYANGKQYGNIVRGFMLTSDIGDNKTIINFINNNLNIHLSNLLIYFDSVTKINRGNTEYLFSIKFNVKKAIMNNALIVDIPFPYKQYTDTEFFVTDMDGNLIPSHYYKRVNDRQILFNSQNVYYLNINDVDELRFTFVHNREKYSINKLECTIFSKENVYEYELPSPFNKLLDLNMRYRVYYDRRLLFGDTAYEYSINKYTGIISFDKEDFKIEEGKEITIIVFYTGTKYTTSIPILPMSGYVYFKKHEIDRNYNKDLCCFFLNGKLVNRDNIIKMSNNIYKISKDLKSRYNIEVMNTSPKIPDLIPFYKKGRKNSIPKQYIYKEMEVMFFVPRNDATEKPHGRKMLNPLTANILTIPNNVLPNHKDWYITLIQHGVDEGEFFDKRSLNYSINFFKDDYTTKSQKISVIGQIRLQGNFEDYVPNSPTALIFGEIPERITTCITDSVICSVKAETIYNADTYNHDKDIDGVLVRLEIDPILFPSEYRVGEPLDTARRYDPKYIDLDIDLNSNGSRDIHCLPKIYYEMTATEYEKDNYINIFEWIVSSEPNGRGQEYYRKTIKMFPDNNPYADR